MAGGNLHIFIGFLVVSFKSAEFRVNKGYIIIMAYTWVHIAWNLNEMRDKVLLGLGY